MYCNVCGVELTLETSYLSANGRDRICGEPIGCMARFIDNQPEGDSISITRVPSAEQIKKGWATNV